MLEQLSSLLELGQPPPGPIRLRSLTTHVTLPASKYHTSLDCCFLKILERHEYGAPTTFFYKRSDAIHRMFPFILFFSCRAPADCVQYFTGTAGTIKSYNFDGNELLNSQRYTNCIRQEEGYCSISYTSSPGTSPDPFQLYSAPAMTVGTPSSVI